nr:hypothetical protein [Cytophagales bacterium]
MKNRKLKKLILGSTFMLALVASQNANAFDDKVSGVQDDFFFNHQPNLKDEELDGMRGGFVTSNGVIIDFAFSANTLVDGQLINQVELSTLSGAASETLRNIIQIGEGNSAFEGGISINNLPNVVTVVQNNIDNLTIQQINMLDLTVQNIDNFVREAVMPEINLQSTLRNVP